MKILGLVAAVLGIYLTVGAFTVPKKGPIDWIYNEEAGLAHAKQEGKPVLVDAWAEWCVACLELDATTFKYPRVVDRLKDFVTIKLDFTRSTPERDRLESKYNIPGLPVLLFYDEEGNCFEAPSCTGYQTADEFLSHLDAIGL